MVKNKIALHAVLIVIVLALFFVGGCGSAAVDTASTQTEKPPVESEKEEEKPSAETEKEEEKPEEPEKDVMSSKEDEAKDEKDDEGDTAEPSNERIIFVTQEYDGENIAEIPHFEYSGEMNPELESINRALHQGLQIYYEDFMENKEENESIQIKSYPFTTDDYLQVVITEMIYPYHIEFFSDGNLESINYDRKAEIWITIDDALDMMGLSEDDILIGVDNSFDTEEAGGYIEEVEIAGFLIHGTPGDEQVEFLLNITVGGSDAYGEWQGFYSYIPDGGSSSGELVRINGEWVLFDPDAMDQMDPPLWYQMYDSGQEGNV